MASLNLVLTIPHGSVVATSFGIEGLAQHLSPGSGKFFRSRSIFADLRLENDAPTFSYLPEGGWRDAAADTAAAVKAILGGKKTKTALSNNGFSVTPLDAYRSVYLVKTGGQALAMDAPVELARFGAGSCQDGMAPDDIARAMGQAPPASREPRLYAIFAPIELLVLSNLTPVEYAWYATRRPGKIFRQVAFAELRTDQLQLAANSRYENGRRDIAANPKKKTKTVAAQDLLNTVAFEAWVGYGRHNEGGLYVADRDHALLYRFPAAKPFAWENAE